MTKYVSYNDLREFAAYFDEELPGFFGKIKGFCEEEDARIQESDIPQPPFDVDDFWGLYGGTRLDAIQPCIALPSAAVNPAYTSQRCPICGNIHHADDRNYTCECGFHIHRDLLGAMNICNSTEFVGNRQTA